jgi:hypothetical protein
MEIHLHQERVNRLAIADHLSEELFVDLLLKREVLLLHRDIVDLVLTLKLVDLHLTVELEGAVLATHTSVK